MAGIEAKGIQELLDLIEGFKKIIESKGEQGRNKLKSIKIDDVLRGIPRKDGKVDPAGWNALGEEKKKELYDELTLIHEALHAAAELDGPIDPKNIMYAEYASNAWIVIWTAIGILFTIFLLCRINSQWNKATGTDFSQNIQAALAAHVELAGVEKELSKAREKAAEAKAQLASQKDEKARQDVEKTIEKQEKEVAARQAEVAAKQKEAEKKAFETVKATKEQKGGADEGTVLEMVILLGALGGSLHLISSLVMFIGNRQLKRSWLPYYLALPFTGAGLAPMVYMLLRVGLISPSGTAGGGTGLANLNLIAIYAFSALTGLFSRVALDKLSEVFATLFRTAEAPSKKDPLSLQKASGGAAPTTDKTS